MTPLTANTQPTKRGQSTPAILLRCLRYLRPYWKMVSGIYVAMLLINGITILTPQFVRGIIDRGIYGGDLAYLSLAVLVLLGITVVKGIITYFQGAWTEVSSQNVAYDLRNAIQCKLDELSMSFHDRSESGQVLSRAIQDVEEIRVTVVFDGKGVRTDATLLDPDGSFCVVYAPEGATADAIIAQMVFHSTTPANDTVVSRDNSVCQAVLAAGGEVMTPNALRDRIEHCRLRADRAMQSRLRKSEGDFENRLFS